MQFEGDPSSFTGLCLFLTTNRCSSNRRLALSDPDRRCQLRLQGHAVGNESEAL